MQIIAFLFMLFSFEKTIEDGQKRLFKQLRNTKRSEIHRKHKRIVRVMYGITEITG